MFSPSTLDSLMSKFLTSFLETSSVSLTRIMIFLLVLSRSSSMLNSVKSFPCDNDVNYSESEVVDASVVIKMFI